MSVSLLKIQVEKARAAAEEKRDNKDEPNQGSERDEEIQFTDSQDRLHQGSLKIDATCVDAEVRYPTDLDLLHDGCKVINRYIDKLCEQFSLVPPVTPLQGLPVRLTWK